MRHYLSVDDLSVTELPEILELAAELKADSSSHRHALSGRSIDVESRHVLEVNGGFARAHGIGAGTRVSYEHLDMTGYDK